MAIKWKASYNSIRCKTIEYNGSKANYQGEEKINEHYFKERIYDH